MFGGTYNFYIDGWSGRCGMPLEFFIAMHQGTRAPDLVREIAKGTKAYLHADLTDIQLLAEKLREGQKLEERIDYYEPALGDVLYYKKPLLDILLLNSKLFKSR